MFIDILQEVQEHSKSLGEFLCGRQSPEGSWTLSVIYHCDAFLFPYLGIHVLYGLWEGLECTMRGPISHEGPNQLLFFSMWSAACSIPFSISRNHGKKFSQKSNEETVPESACGDCIRSENEGDVIFWNKYPYWEPPTGKASPKGLQTSRQYIHSYLGGEYHHLYKLKLLSDIDFYFHTSQ